MTIHIPAPAAATDDRSPTAAPNKPARQKRRQRPRQASPMTVAEIRQAAADEIERLINLLDALGGDPDLEPYLAGAATAGGDDREGDPVEEHRLPGYACADEEFEPSLGWTTSGFLGGDSDLEEQCEGEGNDDERGIADADGAAEFHDQHQAMIAFRQDRERRAEGRPLQRRKPREPEHIPNGIRQSGDHWIATAISPSH